MVVVIIELFESARIFRVVGLSSFLPNLYFPTCRAFQREREHCGFGFNPFASLDENNIHSSSSSPTDYIENH